MIECYKAHGIFSCVCISPDVLSWYVAFYLLPYETRQIYKRFHNEINERFLNKLK